MKTTINSTKLGKPLTFIAPTDGGYVRVSNGYGDYNQIFKRSGAAITAQTEQDLKKVARAYVRRA